MSRPTSSFGMVSSTVFGHQSTNQSSVSEQKDLNDIQDIEQAPPAPVIKPPARGFGITDTSAVRVNRSAASKGFGMVTPEYAFQRDN